MQLEAVHAAADRREHTLTVEGVAAFEARLAYHDPHGNPSLRPDGSVTPSGAAFTSSFGQPTAYKVSGAMVAARGAANHPRSFRGHR